MGKSYEDMKIPFGKYSGKLLADIPNSYLAWLLDQDWFFQSHPLLADMAKKESDYRKKFDIEIEDDYEKY